MMEFWVLDQSLCCSSTRVKLFFPLDMIHITMMQLGITPKLSSRFSQISLLETNRGSSVHHSAYNSEMNIHSFQINIIHCPSPFNTPRSLAKTCNDCCIVPVHLVLQSKLLIVTNHMQDSSHPPQVPASSGTVVRQFDMGA